MPSLLFYCCLWVPGDEPEAQSSFRLPSHAIPVTEATAIATYITMPGSAVPGELLRVTVNVAVLTWVAFSILIV